MWEATTKEEEEEVVKSQKKTLCVKRVFRFQRFDDRLVQTKDIFQMEPLLYGIFAHRISTS